MQFHIDLIKFTHCQKILQSPSYTQPFLLNILDPATPIFKYPSFLHLCGATKAHISHDRTDAPHSDLPSAQLNPSLEFTPPPPPRGLLRGQIRFIFSSPPCDPARVVSPCLFRHPHLLWESNPTKKLLPLRLFGF